MNKNFISESGSVGQPASETLANDVIGVSKVDENNVLLITKTGTDGKGRVIPTKGVVVSKDWWDQQSLSADFKC